MTTERAIGARIPEPRPAIATPTTTVSAKPLVIDKCATCGRSIDEMHATEGGDYCSDCCPLCHPELDEGY